MNLFETHDFNESDVCKILLKCVAVSLKKKMAAKMADEFLECVDVAREFREFEIARETCAPR